MRTAVIPQEIDSTHRGEHEMVPSAYRRCLSLPTAVRSRDSSDDNRSGSTAGNPPLERRWRKFGGADTLLIINEIMVEAAGVELFGLLITRKLMIRGIAKTAKNAPFPDPLYVYCSKILFP